ncbi:MAG TPA: efflux RND transporter periplasmic adaptor subunit [Kiritimatiellia bacterium]|nr:efflux RND transporter periplasmic adaptor subunit [Kiritimatiellia bacterium]
MKRLLALSLAALAAGCGGSKIEPGRAEHAPGRPLPENAASVTLAVEQTPGRVDVVGSVTAAERVKIAARLQAEVREVRASAGRRVAKDDVLLVLDDREIREQLTAAEAQLRQADADYKRTRQLFEARSASEQELTAAESAYQSARAQVDRVRVLQSYTVIQAPLSGVVIERHVEVGDLAAPGQELMALYDPARMRVEAAVPVRLIPHLALGSAVAVTLEHPALTTTGVVAEIVGEIDPRSRSQIVRVNIDRPQADLPPGAFGRLWVETPPRPALYAPAAAIRRVGQLETVQLVRDGRVIDRLVRTGPASGDRVEILSGLVDGDVILAETPR